MSGITIVYALFLSLIYWIVCWVVRVAYDVYRRRKMCAANELQLAHERERLGKYFTRLRTLEMNRLCYGKAHNEKGTRQRALVFEWPGQIDFLKNYTEYGNTSYKASESFDEERYRFSKPPMKSRSLKWGK
jgi:hypothetical protein